MSLSNAIENQLAALFIKLFVFLVFVLLIAYISYWVIMFTAIAGIFLGAGVYIYTAILEKQRSLQLQAGMALRDRLCRVMDNDYELLTEADVRCENMLCGRPVNGVNPGDEAGPPRNKYAYLGAASWAGWINGFRAIVVKIFSGMIRLGQFLAFSLVLSFGMIRNVFSH